MPFCPQCGSPFENGQDFCRSCGAPLAGIVQGSPQPPSSRPVISRVKPQKTPSEKSMQSLPGPKATIPTPILVLGLIGILIIIGVAAFFVFSGSPLPAGTPNSTSTPGNSGILPVIGECPEGQTRCSGKCADLRTDQENCGGCGFSVPFGETCINGQFSSSLVQSKNTSSSGSTGTTPAGSVNTSVTTAGVQGSCPSGKISCNGACRDLRNDAANCGSCGNICSWGQECQNSRCGQAGTSATATATVASTTVPMTITPELSCSGRETACGYSCVNLFTDKKNCGVCGRTCGSGEICVDARCGPACTGDETLCDETCVDLDTDMNNCGSCGTECEMFLPNAKGSLCTYGKCIISSCKTDYTDCDKNVANGCEIYLRTDISNCGSCGTKCVTGKVCYNGKCSDPIKI